MAKKAATVVEEVPAKAAEATEEDQGPKGMNTREAAEMLGVTPQKPRRILRSPDFQNDKAYTRYDLDDETIEKLKAAIAAGADGRTSRKKKDEASEEDAPSELDALEEGDEDEEEE